MKIERIGNKLTIRNIVMLLIVAILLSACGGKSNNKATVHESIDKAFAEDTKQVLKELDHVNENEEPPSERTTDMTDRYINLYDDSEKTDIEEDIYRYTKVLIITTDGETYLESDKQNHRNIRDSIFSLIETGKH